MNTHESYVSLETAKLLKQAGFDWETIKTYGQDKGLYGTIGISRNFNAEKGFIAAPSLAVAQKWLREVKLYNVLVDTGGYENYEYFIDYHGVKEGPNYPFHEYNHDLIFKTYESALEAGINKCLILLLKKG